MNSACKLLLIAAVCAPCVCSAQSRYGRHSFREYEPPAGYVDAYYLPSVREEFSDSLGSGHADGDGFGFRTLVPVAPMVVLSGEYERAHYNKLHVDGVGSADADVDDDEFRIGAGLQWHLPAPVRITVLGEYINDRADGNVQGVSTSSRSDGFGIHGRATFSPAPWFSLYGQVGYVRLTDDNHADGPELFGGAAFYPTPFFRLFVDVRSQRLTDEQDNDLNTVEVRTGVGATLGI